MAVQHQVLSNILKKHRGKDAADRTRIIYGGAVTPENGKDLIGIDNVDGLFVGRAAWKPEGFAQIIALVSEAVDRKLKVAQKRA